MEINQEVSLETELPLQSVQDFVMHWEINKHAGIEINGILEQDSWEMVQGKDYIGTELTIHLADTIDYHGDGVLFRGLIQGVKLYMDHGVGMAHVNAVSASIKLDGEGRRLNHSFQDSSLTYSDVAKAIAEMGGGAVICTTPKDMIEKPLICYKETIWEFLKRIASRQNSFLIPDIKTGRPNLWLGMRSGKQIEADLDDWQTDVAIRMCHSRNTRKMVKTNQMECRASYSLGDWIMDSGVKLVIFGMKAQMEKGDIWFSYHLAADRDIKKDGYFNEAFTGMSLWGKVEETKEETVRITFDMDGKEGKWFFPWRPETGNALYAMPEAGAKAAVYFMNHDESTGIVVRCSGQPPENQKPKDKSLVTPEKGETELFSGSLNIRKDKNRMELKDSSKINFSGEQIEIEGDGKVKFRAKQIALNAVSEIKATTE